MTEQETERGQAARLLSEAYIEIGELRNALTRSRRIGAAVGVLMARHRLTYEAAFDLLDKTSQRSNRKLRDLAETVIYTGDLPTGQP